MKTLALLMSLFVGLLALRAEDSSSAANAKPAWPLRAVADGDGEYKVQPPKVLPPSGGRIARRHQSRDPRSERLGLQYRSARI